MLTQTIKQNGVIVSVSSTDGALSWRVDCVEIDGRRLPPSCTTVYPTAEEAIAGGIAWGEAIRTAQDANRLRPM